MATVVTGTFEAENQATSAVRKLLRSCVPSERVRTLVSARRRSHYASQRSCGRRNAEQPGGIQVAVNAADNVSKCLAVSVFREHGARDIEQTAAPNVNPTKTSGDVQQGVQYALRL